MLLKFLSNSFSWAKIRPDTWSGSSFIEHDYVVVYAQWTQYWYRHRLHI